MNVVEIFRESLSWLQENYIKYNFYTERDIVWTMQTHIREIIVKKSLPYKVFNDYPMMKGEKRSLCADLAIMDIKADENNSNTVVDLAVEFKYEPDHNRTDMLNSKFKPTVIFWKDGVMEDVARIDKFVKAGKCEEGCFVLIDEGKYFYSRDKSRKQFADICWSVNNGVAILTSWSHK